MRKKTRNNIFIKLSLVLLGIGIICSAVWFIGKPMSNNAKDYVVFGYFCNECSGNSLYKMTSNKSFKVVNSIGGPKGRTDFELQELSEDEHKKMDGIMDLVKNEWGKDYLIKYRQATKDGWNPDGTDAGGTYIEHDGEYTYLPTTFALKLDGNYNRPIELKSYDPEVIKLNDYISKKMNSLSK